MSPSSGRAASAAGATRGASAAMAALVLAVLTAVAAGGETLPGRMVFTARVDGQWDLFTWQPAGGAAPRRLTDTAVDEIGPALSPDGRRVAWTDSAGDLWWQDLEGGGPHRLDAEGERGLLLQPALGPAGVVLVVRRRDPGHDDTDLELRPLAGALALELGPAWVREDGPREDGARKDGARRLPMLSSQFSPAWAPDLRRIAFTHLLARWTGDLISEIWEARVDQSYARQLTLLDGFCDQPDWSPDGRSIAFSCDRGDGFALYEVDVADRAVRRLTEGGTSDTEPAYGPDGRHLAFVSTRAGDPALFLLDRDSGAVSALRPFGDAARPCKDLDWR